MDGRDRALALPERRSARPELPEIKSAVHIQHLSGDVTCHGRGQEQRCIDNLVSFAKTTERNLFDEVLRHFVRHPFAHSYIDESRRYGVYGDVLPRKLAC